MTNGKAITIAGLALTAGFVGGVAFVGTGLAFTVIRPPAVAPADGGAKALLQGQVPARPKVEAVAVPEDERFSGGSTGLAIKPDRLDLAPTLGCSWVVDPQSFRVGHRWTKTDPERALCGLSSIDPKTGWLVYDLVQSARHKAGVRDLRPVFFDARGNPHLPISRGASRSQGPDGQLDVPEFGLDPKELAPADVAFFGIELISPDSARLVAEAARKAAGERGLALLPPPRIGQPYPLDLPGEADRRIVAADLKGRAVVVAVLGPSPQGGLALAMLKKLRESYKAEEVAVVVVSFAGSAEDAHAQADREVPDARLVVLPNDPEARRIWAAGSEIERLPVVLLLDRDGVLRARCNPFELKDRVDLVMGRPKPRPAGRTTTVRSKPATPPPSR